MIERKANLVPKTLQIRFKDKQLSICYSVNDIPSGKGIGDVWVNFTPSENLLSTLNKEISEAIAKVDVT